MSCRVFGFCIWQPAEGAVGGSFCVATPRRRVWPTSHLCACPPFPVPVCRMVSSPHKHPGPFCYPLVDQARNKASGAQGDVILKYLTHRCKYVDDLDNDYAYF